MVVFGLRHGEAPFVLLERQSSGMLPRAANTGLLRGSNRMCGCGGGHRSCSTASFKAARRVTHLGKVGRQITAKMRRFCHHFAG